MRRTPGLRVLRFGQSRDGSSWVGRRGYLYSLITDFGQNFSAIQKKKVHLAQLINLCKTV